MNDTLLGLLDNHALLGDEESRHKYLLNIISNSLALEGCFVLADDLEKLVENGVASTGNIRDIELAQDLYNCYIIAISRAQKSEKITVEKLRNLAATLTYSVGKVVDMSAGRAVAPSGEFRSCDLSAHLGGRAYIGHHKLEERVKELCKSINRRRKKFTGSIIDAYNISIDAHFQLIALAPWAEFTPLIARVVMFQIQTEFGVMPICVQQSHGEGYQESISSSRGEGDISFVENFMVSHHVHNIEQLINGSAIDGGVAANGSAIQQAMCELSARQQSLLDALVDNSKLTIRELVVIISVSEKTIKREISSLKNKGVLSRIGGDKCGYWHVSL